MKKGLWIFIGLVVVFLIISYNRGREITEESDNATKKMSRLVLVVSLRHKL